MNRSQLREVIKSIVQRKLLENTSNSRGQQLASSLRKKFEEGDSFNEVSIQTHHGDEPLEIVEWWIANGVLHIGVVADVPPRLNELTPATTSTGKPTTPNMNKNQSNDNQDDVTDQMTDAEKNQIANLQKEQQKLTNEIQKIDGAIQKLKEPLERKVGTLEKAKANKQRKLGTITSRIEQIQRKYSKV